MKGIVIWAHSKCRSTFGLYREVVRQSPVPVKLVFWKDVLEQRIEQGFSEKEFEGVPSEVIGDDRDSARRILTETLGWTHVVCAYQVSAVFQWVMSRAKARGDRVVVYSEAPCEMCLGVKALLKRLYYRFILSRKLRTVVRCADIILNQSGMMGIDRLLRLGWTREQILPFGYASPRLNSNGELHSTIKTSDHNSLRVLHLGSEAPYRGVSVLDRAVDLASRRGAKIKLQKTAGRLPQNELVRAIHTADVVVGCGFCEPWGLRINDAVQEGVPVIVSDGMGVSCLVEQEGCGIVVPKGDHKALANALEHCAKDSDFLVHLTACAKQAAFNWSPASRAAVFLDAVLPHVSDMRS